MTTPRSLCGTALVLSWAALMSARYLAAATLNAGLRGMTFPEALNALGVVLPVCAWVSLAAGLVLSLWPSKCDPTRKCSDMNGTP
jgi:hypothetical protein